MPAPLQSLSGDLILVGDDGQAFRAHSQLLQLRSGVMADLLEEQREQLQQGLLSIPWKGSSEELHLALQVGRFARSCNRFRLSVPHMQLLTHSTRRSSRPSCI